MLEHLDHLRLLPAGAVATFGFEGGVASLPPLF
jgi:hypothetical protein